MRTAYDVGDIVLVPMQVNGINVYDDKSIIYNCTRIRRSNGTLHIVAEDEIKGKVDIEQEAIIDPDDTMGV